MSNVNIKRAVENIRSGTSVYTPIVETVVNAIQAIEEAGASETGCIKIFVHRSKQEELEGGRPPVESFVITDNGIGFTDKNRECFDTLYTDHKIDQGGKGFGRFTCLKYFEDLIIVSVFDTGDGQKLRSFKMGKKTDIWQHQPLHGGIELGQGVTRRGDAQQRLLPQAWYQLELNYLMRRIGHLFSALCADIILAFAVIGRYNLCMRCGEYDVYPWAKRLAGFPVG